MTTDIFPSAISLSLIISGVTRISPLVEQDSLMTIFCEVRVAKSFKILFNVLWIIVLRIVVSLLAIALLPIDKLSTTELLHEHGLEPINNLLIYRVIVVQRQVISFSAISWREQVNC
jgi:hypothetical protein